MNTPTLSEATDSRQLLTAAQTLLLKRTSPFEFPRVIFEALGIRQQELVKKYGFRKADVSECLRGMSRHARIRRALAEELGVAVDVLWPPKLKR